METVWSALGDRVVIRSGDALQGLVRVSIAEWGGGADGVCGDAQLRVVPHADGSDG